MIIFFCQYCRLWHLKSRYLPNAVSQSPRIPLWHLKKPDLPKAPSQSPEKKCRFHWRKNIPRRKPADYPRILLCRILALLHKAVAKTGVSRRKSGNRHIIPEFGFAEILSFGTGLLIKQEFPDAKQETGKLSQKAQLFAVLCLCREKRSFFDKPRLQRLPKRSCRPSEASGDILRRLQKYYR